MGIGAGGWPGHKKGFWYLRTKTLEAPFYSFAGIIQIRFYGFVLRLKNNHPQRVLRNISAKNRARLRRPDDAPKNALKLTQLIGAGPRKTQYFVHIAG